jgi:hypothetical protein
MAFESLYSFVPRLDHTGELKSISQAVVSVYELKEKRVLADDLLPQHAKRSTCSRAQIVEAG